MWRAPRRVVAALFPGCMNGHRLRRAAVLVAALLANSAWASTASGDDDSPHLDLLALRCADRPVDLHPPFSPAHYIYSARLDFADGSFSVDAMPAQGMKVANLDDLKMATMILPGAKQPVVVSVASGSTNTSSSMDYTISVERLDGTDTALRALEMPGATISPVFSPDRTKYLVHIPADIDRLEIKFVPWDDGQNFEVLSLESDADFEASEEWTTSQPVLTTSTEPSAFSMRGQPLYGYPAGTATAGATRSVKVGTTRAGSSTFAPTTSVPTTTTSAVPGGGQTSASPKDAIKCFDAGVFYGPQPNMLGQEKSVEEDALSCQARCSITPSCTFFTFWPDGGCHLQDSTALAQTTQHGVVAGAVACIAPCFASNVFYGPVANMPGTEKTSETNAAACQARCAATAGCTHFTFWPDGGCHLTDNTAMQVSTQQAAEAGPPKCPGARRLLGILRANVGGGRWRALAEVRAEGSSVFLPVSGESQNAVLERNFLFEVGQKRLVVINVRAANGDAKHNRTYQFEVKREPCPVHQPFFAPDVDACAVTCNPGYFANGASFRCERCPMHCEQCTDWDRCLQCEPSHIKTFHIIRMNEGRCHLVKIPWLDILVVASAGIVGLALICCCCCSMFAPSEGRRRAGAASPKHGGAWNRRGKYAGAG
eukprot:CAMPEP_0204179470 /NCGR_PEP_ID=MMETSP0361-20130328/50179_1 /ASSEMBLY_ACC=CAM_ASM_000343 /TAXON_ID=268821 /ORGANISM="Scrippsiella Hangoei, Strain SHTV-5" /LENGTH=654 /DNA_ID=CAMNT_0051138733 /DNA_START=10 /DNA_END=1970 /DNA_ORIENTATION=-